MTPSDLTIAGYCILVLLAGTSAFIWIERNFWQFATIYRILPQSALQTTGMGDTIPPMNNEDETLGIREMAARIGVSESTLFKRIREGKILPSLEVSGTHRKWRAKDVQAWLDAGAPPNKPEETE